MSEARANGLKALETLRRVLEKEHWDPQETEVEGLLRVDFSADDIPVQGAGAEVLVDDEQFRLYFFFRTPVPEHRRAAVMEFITRANFALVVGNFELQLDEGDLRFKASLNFAGADLTETLIRNLIGSSRNAVARYGELLELVVRGELEPAEAIALAESGETESAGKT